MMIKKYTIAYLVVLSFLAGCGTTSNLAPGSGFSADDGSAILVLGLNPRYRIHMLRGPIEDGMWVRPKVDVPEINLFPENGYIVVKVKPTTPSEPLSLSLVFPGKGSFGPCQDANGPVFFAKAGAVNYVGDLNYHFNGSELRFEHTLKEENVRKFLRASYPGYEERLVVHPVRHLKVKTSRCSENSVPIPVYIPSRR